MEEIKKFSYIEITEDREEKSSEEKGSCGNRRRKKYVFVGTKETVDRDGDIVKVDGVDISNFEKNSVVLSMHNYRSFPVGKVINIVKEEDRILFEIEFSDTEEGKTVQDLIDGGYMKAVSIGFIPKKIYDKNGYFGKSFEDLQKDFPEWYSKKAEEIAKAQRVFAECELLEISVVPVPANPDALLVMASKGYKKAYTFTITDKGEDVIEIDLPEVKNAVSYSKHPDNMVVITDRSWDKTRAVSSIRKWASSDGSGEKDKIIWSKYQIGFAWRDNNVIDNFGSYKLPHHEIVDGKFAVVWRGVVSAMASVLGSRGGVNIPAEDKRGVYRHLARHYKENFDKEPPEYKEAGYTLEEAIKTFDEELLEEFIKQISISEVKELMEKYEEVIKEKDEELKSLKTEIENLNKSLEEIKEKLNSSEENTVSPSDKEVENKETSGEKEEFELPDISEEELKSLIKKILLGGETNEAQ